jgi:hypothetical protein
MHSDQQEQQRHSQSPLTTGSSKTMSGTLPPIPVSTGVGHWATSAGTRDNYNYGRQVETGARPGGRHTHSHAAH